MIVWRVYTPTHHTYAADSLSAAESDFIEAEVNRSKVLRRSGPWDPWIKAPFDFPLPVGASYSARFLPGGFNRNALYAAFEASTSVYETAYRFWRFRRVSAAKLSRPWESRRIFSVLFDEEDAVDTRALPEAEREPLLNPDDYSASHRFARQSPGVPAIIYPSVRAPSGGTCVCVYEITKLGHRSIYFGELSYAMTQDASSVLIRANLEGIPEAIEYGSTSRIGPA